MPASRATAEISDFLQLGFELLMLSWVTTSMLATAVFAIANCPSFAVQQVLDRVIVRIESDVILLSDLQHLRNYQILVDGKAEGDQQLVNHLIDQWVVRSEADAAHFPHPKEVDIDRSLEILQHSFGSPEEYEARKKQSGLSDKELRVIVASQLYLSNYLESRFRPAVQVDPKATEDYYNSTLVPRAKAKGQEPPSLDSARDAIQEVLVQRGINEQADQWLKESRDRLHIDILLDAAEGKNAT
jgi:hypothetical protein